eukprot:gene11435-29495_t
MASFRKLIPHVGRLGALPLRSSTAAVAAPVRSMAGVAAQNPHLSELPADYLYHLGLSDDRSGELEFAQMVADNFEGTEYALPYGASPTPIGKTDRYSIFKVGPALISSHGMGQPSISILLHEVTKMLEYAEATDVTYFRLGSSGGIGVEPGSVVVTNGGLNGELKPYYSLPILGEMVNRPAEIDQELVADVVAAAEEIGIPFPVVPGKTMSADCFYEGQGRLDGAICDYTEDDKLAFLEKLHGLQGDQVLTPLESLAEFDQRPGKLAIAYMNHKLGIKK